MGQIELVFDNVQTDAVEENIETVIEYIVEKTMDIPKIILQPKDEITWVFHDFVLNASGINLLPVTQEIMLRGLRTRNRGVLHLKV